MLNPKLLAVFALALLSIACNKNTPSSAAPPGGPGPQKPGGAPGGPPGPGGPPRPPLPVEIKVLGTDTLSRTVYVTGTVMAGSEIELRAEVAGRVTKIQGREGNKISAGSLVLTFEDAELKAQSERAEARLDLAKSQEARIAKQTETGAASARDLEQAQAERRIASSERDLLKAQWAKTQVKAPFGGLLGILEVEEGDYVSPGTRLATLQDLQHMRLEFSIPERDAPKVKLGQMASVSVQGIAKSFAAKVEVIEPRIDQATRQVRVRAGFLKAEGLFPGASAEISLNLGQDNAAIIVPPASLSLEGSGPRAFVVKGGFAELRLLELGVRLADRVEVTKGLAKGDSLIVSGLMQLRPGMPVAPLPGR